MITYFGKNRCKRDWHKFGASYGHPLLLPLRETPASRMNLKIKKQQASVNRTLKNEMVTFLQTLIWLSAKLILHCTLMAEKNVCRAKKTFVDFDWRREKRKNNNLESPKRWSGFHLKKIEFTGALLSKQLQQNLWLLCNF